MQKNVKKCKNVIKCKKVQKSAKSTLTLFFLVLAWSAVLTNCATAAKPQIPKTKPVYLIYIYMCTSSASL